MKCEEKFKDAEKLSFNETSLHGDIKKIIKSYYNWGELLDSTPFAISVLGKLIVMSHQKINFPFSPNLMVFPKKFNYPKSYRSSLLQLSRQGNLAFLKAHENIEKIRVYNSNVSNHIKGLSRLIMSRNESSYSLYRPWIRRYEVFHLQQSQGPSAEVVKEFETVLRLIEEMIVTAKQLELRRRNAQQVVERNKSLGFTQIYYKEVTKALQTASNELTKLKTAWMKLIEFYSKMSILINKSTDESNSFIELVKLLLLETGTNLLDDDEIFANLLDKIQKANEASFLVHQVSDMYVDVSGMYIVDQMAHLDKMMNATEVDMDKLQLELTWSTESDAEGIRHFIKADESSLREKLVERHNQIMNEYKWMIDCFSPEDRQFIQ